MPLETNHFVALDSGVCSDFEIGDLSPRRKLNQSYTKFQEMQYNIIGRHGNKGRGDQAGCGPTS